MESHHKDSFPQSDVVCLPCCESGVLEVIHLALLKPETILIYNYLHIDLPSVKGLAKSNSLKGTRTKHWESVCERDLDTCLTANPPLGKYSSALHESRNE